MKNFWESVKKATPNEYKDFRDFLERWLMANFPEPQIPAFYLDDFEKMPPPIQMGILYEYMARNSCHIELNICDTGENVEFILKFFEDQEKNVHSEESWLPDPPSKPQIPTVDQNVL